MAEKTLADLLAELEGLDLAANPRRFHDIVAEIANHVGELPGGLAGLARSLSAPKRAAAAYVARRLRVVPEHRDLLRGLVGDAHPAVRLAAVRAVGDWPLPELLAPLVGILDGVDQDLAPNLIVSLARVIDAAGPEAADEAFLGVPDAVWRPLLARLSDKHEADRKLKAVLDRRAAISADPAELEDFGRIIRPADVEPAYERDALLDDLVARVRGGGARSFILVGEPGVGKTHVLSALAARLAAETPPWHVLETSTSEIMVGTKYIGEWETRLGQLIAKARSPRRVLLYFTNPHELVGAGTTSKNDAGFLSMLGPHLRRGDVTLVGEATAHAVQRGLERAGQKGYFQLISIAEPEPAAVQRLLARKIESTALRAGVEIVVPREVQDLIVNLAGIYFSGLAEPGRTLELLDEVLAPRLDPPPREPIELRAEDVIAGLSRVSGLPEALLNDRRPLDPAEVRAFFEERVLGQREAVEAMVDLITLVKAGLNDPGKPLGVLFFVGPTGVGKTEIAKALAEYIYGSAERMVRLDLSEYKDYESYEKLIGGRGARDAGGTLAGRVRERPFSVILLDEIEKAHPNVFDLFLQVFDDGRLTDAHGERADFRQAIIVMTSNLGSAAEAGGLGFGAGASDLPGEEKVLREVRRFFRPEFVNRLGKIVVFKPLSGETMRKIVRRELGKVMVRSGILRRGLRVDVDPDAVDLLLEEGFSPEYGARPLKRRVEQLLLLPLARAIVGLGPDDRGALLKVSVDDRKIAVRRRGAPAPRPESERLHLKRPEDERLLSVKPAELPALLEGLEIRVTALAARAAADRLAERKSEIVAATASPSFWDEPPRARRQLAEMVHLEELVEGLARARRRLDDLAAFARSFARHANLKGRFEGAHADFVDELLALEHKFFGEKPEDRRDAFVSIRPIGADREAAEAVELLCRMYGSWGERRGLAVTWLREPNGGGGDALGLLEGKSPFGLLRGEEGLHRFEAGGKGIGHRAGFARVAVSARPDGDAGLPRREVRLERGRGETVAVHVPSGTSVEAGGDVSDELAAELLAAEVEARGRRQAAGGEDRVVRRYNIEGRFAVDEDTGIRVAHKELCAGGLDEILRARLYGAR